MQSSAGSSIQQREMQQLKTLPTAQVPQEESSQDQIHYVGIFVPLYVTVPTDKAGPLKALKQKTPQNLCFPKTFAGFDEVSGRV